MTFETWALFALVCVLPAMTPGPAMLFAISNALRFGARTTILTGLVNGIGVTGMGLMVGLGLAVLLATSALAFWLLKLVGGAYLVYLGVRLWRDRSAFYVLPGQPRQKAPAGKLMAQAMAIALTNPKAALVLAAIIPPFLSAQSPLLPQVMILALTYGAMCVLCHLLIAFAGGWLRRFLTRPDRARLLRRLTGGAFVSFGAAMAASSR